MSVHCQFGSISVSVHSQFGKVSNDMHQLGAVANGKFQIFIDWLSFSEFHREGGLPVLIGGVVAHFDAFGNCRFETGIPASIPGSFDSSVRVRCDGFRVWASGNFGRFGRPDNLFNHDWNGTVAAVDRVLASLGIPAMGSSGAVELIEKPSDRLGKRVFVSVRGAVVSRVDLTCNYRTGSDPQARAVIRWLAGRSVARLKRGFSSDQSVWFSNSRHMLKAYRKGAEMKAHGGGGELAEWCDDEGIVRVEVELKKRLLSDLGLNYVENITQEKLEAVFFDQTEIFRGVDMSDDPDILSAIPARSRAIAAAWMAGQDVRCFVSERTCYRHHKVLREYGIDIMEPRNLETFPVKVRVVDLEPVAVPDWYSLRVA